MRGFSEKNIERGWKDRPEVLQIGAEKRVKAYLRGRKHHRRKVISCSQQRYRKWQNLQM